MWAEDKTAAGKSKSLLKYLSVYGVFGFCQSISVLAGVLLVSFGSLRASIKVRQQLYN